MLHPLVAFRNLRARKRLIDSFNLTPTDIVLDVGSGQNPNPRANVLCDRFLFDNTERNAAPLYIDRPTLLGSAERLPVRDRSFDFVICSHLLEHVEDPSQIISELRRVAPRGYIETPSRIWEKLHSYEFHRWFVSLEQTTLVFQQKPVAIYDPDLKSWISNHRHLGPFLDRHFNEMGFLIRLHWNDQIPHRIERLANFDPKTSGHRFAENTAASTPPPVAFDTLGQKAIRHWGRWLRRTSDPAVRQLHTLAARCACPACQSGITVVDAKSARCSNCNAVYGITWPSGYALIDFLQTLR